ncbi:MAG: hypothetical protein IJR99_01250 [Kiritimatiellae bacterium]|nr:hypothetical protein [Kiritimatiellia bacterium]
MAGFWEEFDSAGPDGGTPPDWPWVLGALTFAAISWLLVELLSWLLA